LKQEGGDMTGGMLAADEIVFTSGKKNGRGQEQAAEGGDEISDQALQAMWLRRIQTKPADCGT
jgi:Ca-activated chloride channel family protein